MYNITHLMKINEHYRHAVAKHPQFCTKLLNSDNIGDYVRLDKVAHDGCEKYWTAEAVLWEEVGEVLLAIMQGENGHAIEECYDTIAVLLRIIDELEAKNDRP